MRERKGTHRLVPLPQAKAFHQLELGTHGEHLGASENRDTVLKQSQASPGYAIQASQAKSPKPSAVGRESLQIGLVLSARYVVSGVAWGDDVRPRQRRGGT